MSERHVELVRRIPGDLSALIDLLDDEVVLDSRQYAPLDIEGVYHGKEATTALLRKWVGSWSDFDFEVEEIIDAGTSLVLAIKESGHGISSGLPMENHYAMVWQFLSDRIVRATTYNTKNEALEAAGLRE